MFGCDAVTRDPTDSGARGMVAIPLKEGTSAKEFRQAAAASSDANQARRLLALAAIRDGMTRQAAGPLGVAGIRLGDAQSSRLLALIFL
jgi:hypothetical protein